MGVEFNPTQNTQPLTGQSGVEQTAAPQSSTTADVIIPKAAEEQLNQLLKELSLPTLSVPLNGLSLDSLFSALGEATRRQSVRDGIDSLEAKGKEQEDVNNKQLTELKEQIDEMAKKKVLDGFKKAFSIIGMVIGAVASIATIAAGALTGNPLLIAAGVVGILMTADAIAGAASDGKYCLSAGFTELGKVMGMSDQDAAWFAMGMQIALSLVTVALSFGAAGANTAAVTAEKASKALNYIIRSEQAMNIGNGVLTTGTGCITIADTVMSYNIANSKADMKDLEAILERIRSATEMEKELVEAEMQRSSDLLGKVKDIVDNVNQTNAAILGAAPAMA